MRHYWHCFLEKHSSDIRGRALEIGQASSIRTYGGSAVQRTDVIDIEQSSSEVTIVADLSAADHVGSDQFDCFINQFVVHGIYDIEAALYHSIRLLKPGGVLLINFPARSGYRLGGLDVRDGGDTFRVYHWFTPAGVRRALANVGIPDKDCELTTYGNFFSTVAYLAGIGAEELTARELAYEDKDVPLLICARVVKPLAWRPAMPISSRDRDVAVLGGSRTNEKPL